jgi:hypothetical protein
MFQGWATSYPRELFSASLINILQIMQPD